MSVLSNLGVERGTLTRRQEIIADLGFHVGYDWPSIDKRVREAVLMEVEGSRGFMALIIKWAGEFDAAWEALPPDDERRESYIGEIYDFAEAKLNALVATVRLEM